MNRTVTHAVAAPSTLRLFFLTLLLLVATPALAQQAEDDAFDGEEDATITGNVLGNDRDAYEADLASSPEHGAVELDPDGSFVYTPDADFFGEDGFTYRATGYDLTEPVAFGAMQGATASARLSNVQAAGQNFGSFSDEVALGGYVEARVNGSGKSFSLGEITDLAVGPAEAFHFPVGPLGSLGSIVVDATGLVVTLAEDGSLRVQGIVAVSGTGLVGTQLGESITAEVDERASMSLSGSLQAQGGSLSLEIPVSFSQGFSEGGASATVSLNGTFVGAGHVATSESEPAAVALNVAPVLDVPVAEADAYDGMEDEVLEVAAEDGLLANDANPDGLALQAELAQAPPAEEGELALADDGAFTFTPAKDFHGASTFTYRIAYDGGTAEEAEVTITVANAIDAPVAEADAYDGMEDEVLEVAAEDGLLANDANPDDLDLAIVILEEPAHGDLSVAADGGFTYTPAPQFNGDDGFRYALRYDDAGTDVETEGAEVALHVAAVADAPIAVADAYSTDRDQPLHIAAPGILANDEFPDGDAGTPAVIDGPAHGQLDLNDDGAFTYTPDEGFFGQDSFTYIIETANASSEQAVVNFEIRDVAPANQPPVFYAEPLPDAVSGRAYDAAVPARDPDEDALTFELVRSDFDFLTLAADGSLGGTPSESHVGQGEVVFRAFDGQDEVEGTFSLTVQPERIAQPAHNSQNVDPEGSLEAKSDPSAAQYQFQVAQGENGFEGAAKTGALLDTLAASAQIEVPEGVLRQATVYAWRVRTLDAAGEATPWSVPATFTTVGEVPGAPELLGPADGVVTEESITLRWQEPNANAYILQVATSASFESPMVDEQALAEADYDLEGLEPGATYFWRVRGENALGLGPWSATGQFSAASNVAAEEPDVPNGFALHGNYPNPFNPSTTIRFTLQTSTEVRLAVYDVLGREVQVVAEGLLGAGEHEVTWEATDLPSGTYLYRLDAGGKSQTRMTTLVK